MPDIDKVLEAEEKIKNIATELGRMKSAADLMDSAQTKIDAVIKTSSDIITKTGEFVKEGTQIVERIGDYDIQADLSKIIETSNRISSDVEKLSGDLGDTKKDLGILKTDFESFSEKKFQEVVDTLNELKGQNEQAGKIIMGLVGGNILLGVILVLKIFQVF